MGLPGVQREGRRNLVETDTESLSEPARERAGLSKAGPTISNTEWGGLSDERAPT